ncbi:hypothetical protein SADUNF_Sadunf10G0020400 [Salix dunnii]|uniref:Uncharacterized protein n=1 Tax=Salix dunnii TaxID=1413687 RepID=A0A835MU02_9ROSI|nr:hypothetical protein SADUNF_Sadunf10G0020400 [Salix dunnii]
MEVEYVSEFPHSYMDRRPRKMPRLAAVAAWDIPPRLQPHTHTRFDGMICHVIGSMASISPLLRRSTGAAKADDSERELTRKSTSSSLMNRKDCTFFKLKSSKLVC